MNMDSNLLALSALAATSTNVVLWIIAAVLLVLFLMRQRARKTKEQDPRH
jgi:membrane protein implicated in regulation of membrane protease activity